MGNATPQPRQSDNFRCPPIWRGTRRCGSSGGIGKALEVHEPILKHSEPRTWRTSPQTLRSRTGSGVIPQRRLWMATP